MGVLKMKEMLAKNIDAIKNIKNDPLIGAAALLPPVMVVLSVIGFIVSLVRFFQNGAYGDQVEVISSSGISAVGKGFVTGTVGNLYSGVFGILSLLCFGVGLLFMMLLSFKKAGTVRRFVLILDAVVILLVGIFGIYLSSVLGSEEGIAGSFLAGSDPGRIKSILLITSLIALISVLSFAVLIATSEAGWLIGHLLIAGTFCFAALPAALWIIENSVSIVFLILVIVGFLVLTVAVIKLIGVLAARRSAKRSAQKAAPEAESEEQEQKPEA